MFLLCAVVLARPGDVQTECVAIKLQTRFCITDHDRRVIDAKKQFVFLLPFLIALAFRELQNLEPVLVWVSKIKRFDAACVLIPIRQTLWTSRGMLDFVLSQQSVSL